MCFKALNKKMIRKTILVMFDIALIFISYIISNFFIAKEIIAFDEKYINTCLLATLIYIFMFILFKVYKSVTEYTGAREYSSYLIISIIAGAFTCILSVVLKLNTYGANINILASFFVAGFMTMARVVFRTLMNYLENNHDKSESIQNVLIIGAGCAGLQMVRDVFPKMRNKYKVVGMIDDSDFKKNCIINGIKIIGGRDKIIDVCKKEDVHMILFSIANISEVEKRRILEICSKTKCKIKVIPNTAAIINSNDPIKLNTFKDIQIEDLLGRDMIELNSEEIKKYIKSKVVLVTGGGGSIGSELCRQIADFGAKQLIMVDIYENTLYEVELEIRKKYPKLKLDAIIASVRDSKRINELFEEYKPELVFHAAAHKHVPLMETSPIEAIKNNVFGTYNVAKAADLSGVDKFVLVSTDKAVNPTSIMGATKRICEMIIQMQNAKSKTNFVAVRFGNVLGSNGSVIPIFKKQIAEGGPITVTHKEITRYFMTIPEAVGLILQAMTYAEGGEIFVLDMGEPVKIYDLAENMIRLSGYEPNVDMKIEVTGLRPGEKLYEELLIDEEGLSKTLHSKIMVTKIMDFDEKKINENLNLLRRLINSEYAADNKKIKKVIKQIVPTFIEEKSQYNVNKTKEFHNENVINFNSDLKRNKVKKEG